MRWRDRISEHPIAMDGLSTRVDLKCGLRQLELLPCGELPVTWAVVPFGEEGTAGSDLSIGVTAVIDDDIDAAAFGLPFLNELFGCATLAAFVGCLAWVVTVQECPQAYGAGWFAK